MANTKYTLPDGREVTIKGSTNRAAKGAPRSKRPGANNSPARQRYWASHRLRDHKIKKLMKYNRMTRAQAEMHWDSVRRTRTKWAR